MWINDIIIENLFSFIIIEQFALVYSIKIMIFSELMLFIALFWAIINFKLILNAWCLFFCFPLLSSNSFAIPYSNVIILLFSSLPIQGASIFYKIGLFNYSIEQLSQTILCGIVFLILQIKEFFYSYISITDNMIGSVFYFTTGLHGIHVFFGLISFWLILMLIIITNIKIKYISLYYIELNISMFFSSYYWHFVDVIWFFVFIIYCVVSVVNYFFIKHC